MKYLLRGTNNMHNCYSMKKILSTNKIRIEFTKAIFTKIKEVYAGGCFNGQIGTASRQIIASDYIMLAILEKQSDGSINQFILDKISSSTEFPLIPNEEYKLFLFFILKTKALIDNDQSSYLYPKDVVYDDSTLKMWLNTGGQSPTTGLMEHGIITDDFENSHLLTKILFSSIPFKLQYFIDSNSEAIIESGIIRSDVLNTFAWQRDGDVKNADFHYDYYGDYDKSKTHFILYDPSGSMIYEINNASSVISKTLPSFGKYVYVFELFDFEDNLLKSKTETYNALEAVVPLFNSERDQNDELKIEFNDLSLGNIISWNWNFGDNMGTSNDQNPVYTYQEQGSYMVTLTVSNGDVSKSFKQSVQVYSKTCNHELNKYYKQETCTKVVLEYNNTTLNNRKIIVTDYAGKVFLDTLLSSTQTLVEFNIPEDGMYFVNYLYDNTGVEEVSISYPIYSLCAARDCYMKMLKKIQCNPADDCDKNIDSEDLRKNLNSITGILYLLDHYMKWDMIKIYKFN